MTSFRVASEPLNIAALNASMQDGSAGAYVCFEGWVRDTNDGLPVNALEYEIFNPLAISEGEKVLQEAAERFHLTSAFAVHREGLLKVGDCAIWIGVTASHRGAAFDGCRYIIDEVKHRLPVWKKEHYAGLEPVWVNCQHKDHHVKEAVKDPNERYARQIILPEIGLEGQKKLSEARILVVGAGGLGSSALMALTAAGVGTVGIADYDVVQATNLHRQILYTNADIEKPKSSTAALRLTLMNPQVNIITHDEKITSENAAGIAAQYDLVLDCSDNFKTKYLLNDVMVSLKKPLIQASIYRFEGQLLCIDASDDQGCLRCLWPEPPAPGMIGDCMESGVLGTVPMLFGTLQANEAIKIVTGHAPAEGLLTFDLFSLKSQNIKRRKNSDCPACGKNARSFVNDNADFSYEIEAAQIHSPENLSRTYTLIDVREPWEIEAHPLPDAMNLPFTNFSTADITIPKDKKILIVCAHGVRSDYAAKILREAGWKNSYTLSGGLQALSVRNAVKHQ